MHANAGDWLVIESAVIDRRSRRGLILEVSGTDGRPPYRVRWSDDNHEALVYPGPDAHVAPAGPTDAHSAESS
jgi:hypothetical protein